MSLFILVSLYESDDAGVYHFVYGTLIDMWENCPFVLLMA